MKARTVLMYHAIVAGDAVGADPHYSVSPAQFARQLALIAGHGSRPASVRELLAGRPDAASRPPVCLTFDDGHLSNGAAAEQIARHGGSAEFFVNPSMVGKPGFLDWPALREMAALGMSVQSHGMHHRYLDQLSPAEVQAELADSKAAIEDAIGQPVTIYAPAGGRMPPGFMATARQLGYAAVCSSRAGVWPTAHAPSAGEAVEIPRLAMLHNTDERRFIAWITQHPVAMFKQRARHQVLGLSKKLLGNQGHERLRALLLGSRTEAPAASATQPVSTQPAAPQAAAAPSSAGPGADSAIRTPTGAHPDARARSSATTDAS